MGQNHFLKVGPFGPFRPFLIMPVLHTFTNRVLTRFVHVGASWLGAALHSSMFSSCVIKDPFLRTILPCAKPAENGLFRTLFSDTFFTLPGSRFKGVAHATLRYAQLASDAP